MRNKWKCEGDEEEEEEEIERECVRELTWFETKKQKTSCISPFLFSHSLIFILSLSRSKGEKGMS